MADIEDDDYIEGPLDENAESSGKFDKLLGEDSKKYKLSGMFKDWFLDYASYTILDRAVPHIVDGLKPVQRRVLHAMFKMDDGSYTKVANIVGQAMQYHPHGDQSILGALVTIGQKGYAIDCQGNWGNILTGDKNAAPRYIEARLSKFAKEVIFDPKITPWMTSYDGRNQEPTELPVRFPLLLAQGTEGIAVGMASKILPHNFNELIDASIAILKGEPYELYPDFPTGGFADCSKYNKGERGGCVKVRAKIEKIDKNTIAITELPYGKTSQMLIDSILKVKDKGNIKFKKIDDMTTAKVEILIHLPNDVSPDKTIDALYAVTDCETKIYPNACVIVDDKPRFMSVNDILEYDTNHTKELLGRQLQIRLDELEADWHYSSLEKIFFEERVYKILEQDQRTWEMQLQEVLDKMLTYQHLLRRPITMDDIQKLVEKPVRKISKFDVKAVEDKIRGMEAEMAKVRDNLDNLTRYTIEWFRSLKKKYGKDWPRLTTLTSFENISATKVVSNNAKLVANLQTGFVGIGMKKADGGEYLCDCSDMSEVIVIRKNGTFLVTKVSDKAFFGENLEYVGVFNRGDERTIYNLIYRDGKSSVYYAKRFAITGITRDKEYDLTAGTEGSTLMYLSVNHNGEAETVRVQLRPRQKTKKTSLEYDFSTLSIKGRSARGNLVTKFSVQRITLKAKGTSTISGKDIWYDTDVQRLNDEGRGEYLGQFEGDDKVLAIFKGGTYYTTSYDLSNRYQGDVRFIGKLDPDKVYSALYWDNAQKAFYVKRFSFALSDNTAVSFISEGKGSYLVDLSEDLHPVMLLTFKGKNANRPDETVRVDEFIAKKGVTAKGKKCSPYEVGTVSFTTPLHLPEDDIPAEEEEGQDNAPEEVDIQGAPPQNECELQHSSDATGSSPSPVTESAAPPVAEPGDKGEESPVERAPKETKKSSSSKKKGSAPKDDKGTGHSVGDVVDLGPEDIPDDEDEEPNLFSEFFK